MPSFLVCTRTTKKNHHLHVFVQANATGLDLRSLENFLEIFVRWDLFTPGVITLYQLYHITKPNNALVARELCLNMTIIWCAWSLIQVDHWDL